MKTANNAKQALFCAFIFSSTVFSMSAVAELHNRGGGLIYDDVLDVTWLQNANPAGTLMSWNDAVSWVADFEYYDSVRDVTWSDWRLPLAGPVNGVSHDDAFGYDGATDNGYNISSVNNELGYMFHVNLGLLSYAATDGTWPQTDFGFSADQSGPFQNMGFAAIAPFWTGTEYPPFDGMAYLLPFETGFNHGGAKDTRMLVWPVRDGDVGLP